MKVQVHAKDVGMPVDQWVIILYVRGENDIKVCLCGTDEIKDVKAWDICGVELSPNVDIHFDVGKVSTTEIASDDY
jgi:hypothetical protein